MELAEVGALVGDRVRAAVLMRLLDRGSVRASELAVAADASPSLTSAHLKRLLDGGLVAVETVGRTRRYRLASLEVAEMLEAMQLLTGPATAVTSLRGERGRRRLRRARFCYDHLAGVVGTAVTEALVEREALTSSGDGLALGGAARPVLAEIEVDLDLVLAAPRPAVRRCLDWTERRPHLSGGLGAAVATRFVERAWVVRRTGSRGLDVTPDGVAVLASWLGLHVVELDGWREGA
jgi:DNA-binding transcriptional ArsR family regulator